MIGAAGLAGAEMAFGRPLYKDHISLRGPVKKIDFHSEKLTSQAFFSQDGVLISRRIQNMERQNKKIFVWRFDRLERELLLEEWDEGGSNLLTTIQTTYQNEAKTYQEEKWDSKEKKRLYVSEGILTERLLKKNGQSVSRPEVASPPIEYGYDSQGNLIEISYVFQKIKKKYTDKNQFAEIEQYWASKYGADFTLSYTECYSYDEHGTVTTFKKRYYENGSVMREEERCFTDHKLDTYGNWTKRTVTDQDGKVEIHTRTISYYE